MLSCHGEPFILKHLYCQLSCPSQHSAPASDHCVVDYLRLIIPTALDGQGSSQSTSFACRNVPHAGQDMLERTYCRGIGLRKRGPLRAPALCDVCCASLWVVLVPGSAPEALCLGRMLQPTLALSRARGSFRTPRFDFGLHLGRICMDVLSHATLCHATHARVVRKFRAPGLSFALRGFSQSEI